MIEFVDGMPINRMNDRYVKFLLGSEKRKNITLKFINSVFEDKLPLKVSNIKFVNRDIDQENLAEKWGAVDIIYQTSNDETVITEFQAYAYMSMVARLLDYWAEKFLTLGIKQDYDKLKPVYCICVQTFNLLKQKDRHHNLYLIKNYEDDDILTDLLRIHFIGLPKWSKNKIKSNSLSDLDIFISYLSGNVTNEERLNLSKRYPLMAQLLKEEDVFFADKKNRDAYLYLERRKRDEMSHENYIFDKGKKEAIDEIVRNMKKDKVDIAMIKKYTGLSEEEINAC